MKVGVIQLSSELDPNKNLEKIRSFIENAKKEEVEYIFLPEVFYSMSDGRSHTPYLVEGENEHYQQIKKLALDYSIYILAGSAATKVEDRIVNRSFNFSPTGEDLGHYDKINLFSCELKKVGEESIINESDIYSPGNLPKLIKAKDLIIGLSICFDIRFPNMYREYVKAGANLLTIPAAFTKATGRAHWHTLVRARAIENQCFVVAPGQWGEHNDRIQTFGHSLIVDPWGEILADAGEGEKLITAEINLSKIDKVRRAVKMNQF